MLICFEIKKIIIVAGPNQPEFKKYIKHLKKDRSWLKLKVEIIFTFQRKLRGNGDAIMAAKKFIKNKPFLVCFSDDLLVDKFPPMKKFLNIFEEVDSPVVVLEPVEKKFVHRYGIVRHEKTQNKDLYLIKGVVEKPSPKKAPSNLSIIGRYVLTPAILKELAKLYPYKGKEIGIADALKNYAAKGGRIYGWHFRGKRFDAGSKTGLLQAQTYFGLHHKEIGPEFKKYLKSL